MFANASAIAAGDEGYARAPGVEPPEHDGRRARQVVQGRRGVQQLAMVLVHSAVRDCPIGRHRLDPDILCQRKGGRFVGEPFPYLRLTLLGARGYTGAP